MLTVSNWGLTVGLSLWKALRHWAQPSRKIACPAQVALALQIVRFSEMLEDMLDDLLPNRITDYAYVLSDLFSNFYTECKARRPPGPSPKALAAGGPNDDGVRTACFTPVGAGGQPLLWLKKLRGA